MAETSKEQSHRDEMSAAIRAQRERNAVPKTIAPAPEPAEAEAPEPRKSLFDRFRSK